MVEPRFRTDCASLVLRVSINCGSQGNVSSFLVRVKSRPEKQAKKAHRQPFDARVQDRIGLPAFIKEVDAADLECEANSLAAANVLLRPSAFGGDAALIGAATLPFTKLFATGGSQPVQPVASVTA
jgi:hypothetical protein